MAAWLLSSGLPTQGLAEVCRQVQRLAAPDAVRDQLKVSSAVLLCCLLLVYGVLKALGLCISSRSVTNTAALWLARSLPPLVMPDLLPQSRLQRVLQGETSRKGHCTKLIASSAIVACWSFAGRKRSTGHRARLRQHQICF